MRKYFLSFVALVGMLFATSCQESLVEPQMEGPTTFTVQLPDQMGTKAEIGSANTVNQLFVSVYAENFVGDPLASAVVEKEHGDGTFTVSFNLIQDQRYSLIFWAQTKNAYVQKSTNVDATYDLENIEISNRFYSNENGAAFYACKTVTIDGNSKDVTLRRPFAQLNIGTTVESLTTDAGNVKITGAKIKVENVASSFNTVKGFGEGSTTIYGQPSSYVTVDPQGLTKVIAVNGTDYAKLEVGGESYVYVTMDYLPIISSDSDTDPKDLVNINLLIDTDQPTDIEHNFHSVPVQRNYRTNIVGNLISSTTDFNVVVDDKFVDENGDNVSDDYNMLIWDGESIKVPSYDETTSTYSISNGAELAWLAATVSGDPLTRSENTSNSLAGKTVKLTEDIYLGENEWKPIGMGGKHFEGIFDGQGHTIYGLKVGSRYSGAQAALFCSAAGSAQFKDFTIDGAKIIYPKDGEDYYAAGVVGTIYGNLTFENITVKNSRITGNNKVAGLIAHDGTSTQITIDNCHILDSYIASEDLKDGGCVGGMIGYYATGVAGKENNISNSSVEGCTIVGVNSSNSGKRANSEFIGSIMTKDDMVLNITDCILEGNTFTQTINGTDPVTYLSAFNPQYIGGDREEKTLGTITISINGETPAVRVTSSEQLQQVVNNATTDITVEFANDLEGKIILYQKEGVKVTIDGQTKKYKGGIQIFGDNNFTDYAMEIKNIKFVASGIDNNLEGCIYVTDNNDQLNCNARNVTIQDCTFEGVGNVFVAIRQAQGGTSQDWTINNCEVLYGMHSFLQIDNMSGLRVYGCTVKSKNGANLNQTVSALFEDCKFDVNGYAVRVGVNQDDLGDVKESFNFKKCQLKSANDDGDAVVIIRATAQNAILNFVETTLDGDPMISGNTSDTKINGIELPQQDNEIWYTATALVHAHFYKDKFGEGTDLVSNVWDETTGKGVITLSGDVTIIGVNAFYGREHLLSVSIPNSVTEIGEDAFDGCLNLTKVTFSQNLVTIGPGAFGGCENLTNVVLPEGLTTISDAAFQSCEAMASITIPSSVTYIGTSAFYLSRRDFKVYCKPTTPPTVGNQPFNKWWAEIYVPTASLSAYQEKWGSIADNIYDGNF